jgi:ribosomal protein S18 acetylase RimI-like enzyme
MLNSSIHIRRAVEGDISSLLDLMRGLAQFEAYAADFAVDESTLRAQGFTRQPPDFYALVAEAPSVLPGLAGMLVYYIIPFTFRARPTLYIKELYVADAVRRLGVGEALMRAAAAAALEHDCATIEWQVAEWNTSAQKFYERLGAQAAREWVKFALSESALRALAAEPLEPGNNAGDVRVADRS